MIRSVAVRLTLIYLGIIMVLSISFSVVIYRLSSDQLRHAARPIAGFSSLIDAPTRDSFEEARRMEAENARHTLQRNLVFLNVGTLVLGSVASYALARRTLQPIEEAFEAQGRFTADASHELRTPLTAMQTSIEVGLRNPKLTLKGSKELLQSMLDEVQKLSSLSNGLLKLTRSTQEMPQTAVQLNEAAKEAVDQLQLAASQRKIVIHSTIPALTVLGDFISIKEVVVILLDNAIKYSPEDTTITINGERSSRFGQLSVSDQGQGIKATDMTHIFDRFYRADSSRSRRRVEGYGLGLSIARKIAEAHHGSLEAVSQAGEGSIFTLKIPLFDKQ
jgi:signal transduction histidine kinase